MNHLIIKIKYIIGVKLLSVWRDIVFSYDELRGYLIRGELEFLNAKIKLTPFSNYITKAVALLKEKIEYSDDEIIDVPMYPEQLFFRKVGNCNDFSYTIMMLIQTYRTAYPCQMMIVRSKSDSRGHAVCCIFDPVKMKWLHASNWGVYFIEAKNLDEVAKSVYPDADYYVTYDKDLKILDIQFL